MDYSEDWFSRFFQDFLVDVGQKRRFFIKIYLSILSSTVIWNANHVLKIAF